MKKNIFIGLICFIAGFFLCIMGNKMFHSFVLKWSLRKIGCEELTSYEAIEIYNNVGFHGDGETYYVFQNIDEKKMMDVIDKNEGWENTPIPEELFNVWDYYTRFNEAFELIEKQPLKEAEDVYWFFYDEQNQKESYSVEEIAEVYSHTERSSFNIIFAVWNAETKRLYYGACDS